MTTTIWKYPLGMGETVHSLPAGSRILTVQMQGGAPHMWALVDNSAPYPDDTRRFYVTGAGHAIGAAPDHLIHIGTVQDGPFVWHAFEVLTP